MNYFLIMQSVFVYESIYKILNKMMLEHKNIACVLIFFLKFVYVSFVPSPLERFLQTCEDTVVLINATNDKCMDSSLFIWQKADFVILFTLHLKDQVWVHQNTQKLCLIFRVSVQIRYPKVCKVFHLVWISGLSLSLWNCLKSQCGF